MKIILSRKAFDSQYGKIPNLILPNNTLLPFPIPDKNSGIKYSEISSGIEGYDNLYTLIKYLGNKNIKLNWEAHLDPDLIKTSYPRENGWKPVFGQDSQALSHLINQNVGINDLFLFFGTFQEVQYKNGTLEYVKEKAPVHILFGYLLVGDIINIDNNIPEQYDWLRYHPHFRIQRSPNYIYISSEIFKILDKEFRGAGIFSNFSKSLILSNDGDKKSLWKLPNWFYPFFENSERAPLTYHSDPERWQIIDEHVLLKTVDKGQEFVFDSNEYPEAIDWVYNIMESST